MKNPYADSLAHTTWECKYNIVFAPKSRKQINIDINDILTQCLLFIDYKNKRTIKMVERSKKSRNV